MPLTPAEWSDKSASFETKEVSELEALNSPPPLYSEFSDLENSDEERMLSPNAEYSGSH